MKVVMMGPDMNLGETHPQVKTEKSTNEEYHGSVHELVVDLPVSEWNRLFSITSGFLSAACTDREACRNNCSEDINSCGFEALAFPRGRQSIQQKTQTMSAFTVFMKYIINS
ncbi:hypothetical protein TNCT_676681 [Trichonephila clavata]|uniref:Uncharacterized protein n=1 Tax=Trichonephila clavata TaxID=2740835 RepID=A0A8X6FIK7_TRICU|nr:hypothetical protein TNCT_676681 [Trichonephila clavata]